MYDNLEEFKEKYYNFKKKYEKEDFHKRTDLCEIMWRNNSDKSYPEDLTTNRGHYETLYKNKKISVHNYTIFYSEFFSKFKNEDLSIFEVGLGSNDPEVPGFMGEDATPGASLYGWSEYFSKSRIYGGDIDDAIIFSDKEKRIVTYCMDQKDKEAVSSAFNNIGEKMDIIIDDGRHLPDYSRDFFDNSIEFLKEGGLFIVEDLFLAYHNSNLKERYFSNLEYIKTKVRFADILTLKSDINHKDNNLMVILK